MGRKYFFSFAGLLLVILALVYAIRTNRDETPRGQLARVAREWKYDVRGDSIEIPTSALPDDVLSEIRKELIETRQRREGCYIKRVAVDFEKDGATIYGASVTVAVIGGDENWGYPAPRLDENQTKEFVEKAIARIKQTNKR